MLAGCGEPKAKSVTEGIEMSEVEKYRAMVEESQKADAEASEAVAGYKAGPEG